MPAKSHSAVAEGFGNRATHGWPSSAGERFKFRASICDEGTSPTNAARCDWRRCLLRRQSAVLCEMFLSEFSDFVPVVRQLTIESRLCRISASCRCKWEEATHTPQGRAASGDSSGGETYHQAWIAKQYVPWIPVMPGSAGFMPQTTARTHAWCPRVASAVQVSACSS